MAEKAYKFRVYSRDTIEGQYPNGLAYSVHMAVSDGGEFVPMHNNYGLLFAKADVDERNVIVPAFTRNIRVAKISSNDRNKYVITGENTSADGTVSDLQKEEFWSWLTEDFINFEELGIKRTEELEAATGLPAKQLRASDEVTVSKEMAEAACHEWNPIKFEKAENSASEGKNIRVLYSDGSYHDKNLAEYPNVKFPFARGFGDPVVLLWENEYYYIATNDNVGDIGFYARKADTIDGLFADNVQMHIILDKDEKRELIQTFWAPEFHVIGERLCILFAVSNEQWGPQCHIMRLKEGGDILKAEDWEDPVKIKSMGGKKLGWNGITLDMTYVKSGNRHYYVWSYREHIGSPLDSGSMIMAGEFLPENPYELITEPVCLSRPLYGFENVRGTINNEGPYAFYHRGKIYLTYSGGDARGYLYTVGLLTADDGDDLCDVSVWNKAKTPVLSFASVPGEYGPGHNSFFRDRNGDWWIAFHAVTCFEEKVISDSIRRVHFDINGKPRFDLAWEDDLPEEYRRQ